LKYSPKTLETILSNFFIFTDEKMASAKKVGDRVNLGLHVLDLYRRRVVPELARIEISKRGGHEIVNITVAQITINLLKEYLQTDKAIFDGIEKHLKKSRLYDMKVIRCDSISISIGEGYLRRFSCR
jgi:hypothetical protein